MKREREREKKPREFLLKNHRIDDDQNVFFHFFLLKGTKLAHSFENKNRKRIERKEEKFDIKIKDTYRKWKTSR